jgi:hypothetical protein
MLGVFVSPRYATDHSVYLTYSEPGDVAGASSLALARARLNLDQGKASLEGLQVLWHDMPKGRGGQFGAQIAFSPDGQYLFLTVGDRQRMTPAQDPNTEVGKILRLTLDGKPAPGNPTAGKVGTATIPLINPPSDTEAAKTAPVVSTYTFPGPNLAPAETWTSGHRTPYGLAFAPDGRLWEVEHGPRGGDELNLIEPGKNYGWPLVSYAVNYNGVPIPSPDTRPDLTKPVIYWTPIIAPGNLMFYSGAMFSGVARLRTDGRHGDDDAQSNHVRWQGGCRARRAMECRTPDSRRGAGSGRRALDARGRESGRTVPRHAEAGGHPLNPRAVCLLELWSLLIPTEKQMKESDAANVPLTLRCRYCDGYSGRSMRRRHFDEPVGRGGAVADRGRTIGTRRGHTPPQ